MTGQQRPPRCSGIGPVAVVLLLLAARLPGQGSQEQLAFWKDLQTAVIDDRLTDLERMVEEQPEVAQAVFRGVHGQWQSLREEGKELEAAELTPFLFHLSQQVAATREDALAKATFEEIGMAPRAFRDTFELYWRRRAMAQLHSLVRDHRAAAYGCVGSLLRGYQTLLARGRTDQARYDFEAIYPLALLIEDAFKDPEPRTRASPMPEGYKPPSLEATFVPGNSELALAEEVAREAMTLHGSGDLNAALNAYLRAAAIYRKVGETKSELGCRQQAADIAIRAGDWPLAAQLLPDVEALATQLDDTRTRIHARDHLQRIALLRSRGEIEDRPPPWEVEESFRPWRTTRATLRELGPEVPSVHPTLDPDPVMWRWVALGGDSSAQLPLPGHPRLWRLGGDLYVDAHLDSKPSLEITGDGRTVATLTLQDPGGRGRDYLARFHSARSLTFMGVEFSLGGRDLIFYRTAGYLEGRLGSQRICVVDASADGRYDTFELDGFAVGRRPEFITALSRIVRVEDRLYELAPDPAGQEIRYREFIGATGGVTVKASKGRIRSCLLRPRGTTRVLLECADAGSAEVPVPAGEYVLEEATLTSGEHRLTVRGGERPPLVVAEGGEVALQLGHDLVLEVAAYRERHTVQGGGSGNGEGEAEPPAEVVVLPGTAVEVKGAAGERYGDFRPDPLLPSYEIREGGEVTGRGTMERNAAARDHLQARFPADLVVPLQHPERPTEVRLILDHPVLGLLETEWTAVR